LTVLSTVIQDLAIVEMIAALAIDRVAILVRDRTLKRMSGDGG